MIFEAFEEPTLSPSPQDAATIELSSEDALSGMEDAGRRLWGQICREKGFTEKYGRDLDNPGAVHCYLFTRKPRADTYAFEAFAYVHAMAIMKEELVFHPKFESLIERYTKTRAKPNPVLMETRSTEFCYRLTILVEAITQSNWAVRPELRLLREFAVLHHVWESYRSDLLASVAPADFLVGVPMPFEFANVAGHAEYDFNHRHGAWHRGLRGEELPLSKVEIPGSSAAAEGIQSTLSYLALEKLGPTVQYMLELLRSQRKIMTLATALKILDQLLCRLMVLHKYGVIMGCLDTRFLNFGVREASNVLYISRYDCAVVAPTQHRSAEPYSERCASLAAIQRREVHFVNDIESAFYIFLSLIFPLLPWDDSKSKSVTVDTSSMYSQSTTTQAARRITWMEEKANFWSSISWFQRMLRHINYDFTDTVYQGFTADLLTMLYTKTQEILVQCETIPQAHFMANVMTPSSPANNAYSGLRRIIALYFRFESLTSISRDPICQKKLELLLDEEPTDRRVLWNLNDWCWKVFYPAYVSKTRTKTVSMIF